MSIPIHPTGEKMNKLLRFLVFYISKPIFSSVVAAIESLFLRMYYDRAKMIEGLEGLRESCRTAGDLEDWYEEVGFAWKGDPLGGALDYASRPWVSFARKSGDCDDMAALAEQVLKGKYPEVRRAQTNVSIRKGHVIVVMRDNEDKWWMMSNQNCKGSFPDAETAIRSYYGDRTSFFYVY